MSKSSYKLFHLAYLLGNSPSPIIFYPILTLYSKSNQQFAQFHLPRIRKFRLILVTLKSLSENLEGNANRMKKGRIKKKIIIIINDS